VHQARTSALLLESSRFFFLLSPLQILDERIRWTDLTRTLDTWVFSCSPPVRVHATEAVRCCLLLTGEFSAAPGPCLPTCHGELS
jgi:hypothetical protein